MSKIDTIESISDKLAATSISVVLMADVGHAHTQAPQLVHSSESIAR